MACCCRRRKNIYYVNEGFGTPAPGKYNSSYKPDATERTPRSTKLSSSSSVPETNSTRHGNGTTNTKMSVAGTGGHSLPGSQVTMQPSLNGAALDHTDGGGVIHHIEEIPRHRRTSDHNDGLPTGSIARREHIEPLTEEPVKSANAEDANVTIASDQRSSLISIENNASPPMVTSTPTAQDEVFTESAVINALATPPSNTSDHYITSESTITGTTVTTINALEDTTLVESPGSGAAEAKDDEPEEVVFKKVHMRRISSGSGASSNSEKVKEDNEVNELIEDKQDVDKEKRTTSITIGDADVEDDETGAAENVINSERIDTFMVRSEEQIDIPPPDEYSRDSVIYENTDYDYENVPSPITGDGGLQTATKTVTTTETKNDDSSTTITKVTTITTSSSMSDEQLADSHEIHLDDQVIDYVHS